MAKTLTIVARDPQVPKDADPLFDYGDVQLQNVLDLKLAGRNVNEHILERAGSVEELAAVLLTHKPDAALQLIQIVAHGDIGELQIGIGKWGRPADLESRTVVLTSDRSSYGLLKGCVNPKVRVLLLGCNVGECDPGLAGDGPILVFDMAHMLECEVSAPAEATYADHLDAAGVYIPPDVSVVTVVHGGKVTVGTATDLMSTHEGSPNVAFVRLLRAASSDRRIADALDLNADHQVGSRTVRAAELQELVGKLAKLIGPAADRTPILAAPRFIFEAVLNGQEALAEFIANGRLLRLTVDGQERVFHITDRRTANDLLDNLSRTFGLRSR